MISSSNINVLDVLKIFKSKKIDISLLVPTHTGFDKSIMDATQTIQQYFREKDIFNYNNLAKGNKEFIKAFLLSQEKIVETKISLYRPKTKNGDPRLWVYNLKKNAQPNDLLALVALDSNLVIVNCSQSNLSILLDEKNKKYSKLFYSSERKINKSAIELLSKLNEISKRGYIQTLRPGDTGVGYTGETLLGISANSSKAPDFKGIEIKFGRKKSTKSGRSTIFSQVPNWDISRVKGKSKELLYLRGKFKEDKQRIQLFHEISAIKKNSYNLKLQIDNENNLLHQIYIENNVITRDVTWEFQVLERRLKEKHKETFWVYVDTIGKSGDKDEKFHYKKVLHTSGKVDTSIFRILIETGVITVDYTIKEIRNKSAKDQGYLFKIHSKDLNLLFDKEDEYELGL